MPVPIDHLFRFGKTQTLQHLAFDLPFCSDGIQNVTAVIGRPNLENLDLAGLFVDLDLDRLTGKGVGRARAGLPGGVHPGRSRLVLTASPDSASGFAQEGKIGYFGHCGLGRGNALDKNFSLPDAQVGRVRFQQVTGFLEQEALGFFSRPDYSDTARIGNSRPPWSQGIRGYVRIRE